PWQAQTRDRRAEGNASPNICPIAQPDMRHRPRAAGLQCVLRKTESIPWWALKRYRGEISIGLYVKRRAARASHDRGTPGPAAAAARRWKLPGRLVGQLLYSPLSRRLRDHQGPVRYRRARGTRQ